jgi:hypothetical protein
MTTNRKRLVEGFDPEYNSLSKTLKITLVLDEEAIRQIQDTSVSTLVTPDELTDQVLELLERSIHLNTPRGVRTGPHGVPYGGSW